MTERGGPTTQSGILYQNSVAALYLGRLCDATWRPESKIVQSVRVEAPEEVDDIVVTFADEHKEYIQAKETIKVGDNAWNKLWKALVAQYRKTDFKAGKDRLGLYFGDRLPNLNILRDLLERASHNTDLEAYKNRLTKKQKVLLERIRESLGLEGLTDADFVQFLSHIHVEFWERSYIERDLVPYWMPQSNKRTKIIFRLLRDRVGKKARERGEFFSHELRESLCSELSDLEFETPTELEHLRNAIRSSDSQLRQQRCTIANTDCHIQRDVVNEITNWLKSEGDFENNVSILLDQAGMGKSVVLHDVLCELEQQQIDVLAIKADSQLANITELVDISKGLGLDQPVEQIVSQLAKLGRVAVIIDQIDALSLSLAHDHRTLDIVLDLIGRLRCIPNVRIVFSCRVFDYHSDPRFKRIATGRPFAITEFSEDDVRAILSNLKIDYDSLPGVTQKLLCTPLHLDLFAMAMESGDSNNSQPHRINSLQDLYDLLWQNIILKNEPKAPPMHERVDVIYVLTEHMDDERRTSGPQSLFHSKENAGLENAVSWLASNGIIIQGGTEWSFLHQTFFDYCYARRFVESHEDLVSNILSSPQGIFERLKLLNVISYMRGKQGDHYLRVFIQLIDDTDLRFHLYDLLLRWFGSIQDPSNGEWGLFQTMLNDKEKCSQLLISSYGNSAWFKLMYEKLLPSWISRDSDILDTQIIPYLESMVEIEQAKVVTLVQPYLGENEKWIDRIHRLFSRVRRWSSPEAIHLFEEFTYKLPNLGQMHLYEIGVVAQTHPETGIRLLRHILDRTIEQYKSKRQKQIEEQGDSYAYRLGRLMDEIDLLEYSSLEDAFKATSKANPRLFIKEILPWLEQVIDIQGIPDEKEYSYSWDEFCGGWYGDTFRSQKAIINGLTIALIELAKADSKAFRQIAERLAKYLYSTPHQLLCNIYQEVPKVYAEDALRYLLADRRRLNIGEHEQYDTRQVVSAIYSFLNKEQQLELENYIMSFAPIAKYLGVDGLRWRGIEQYRILHSIPFDLLSPGGKKRLRQWKYKFPDYKLHNKPRINRGGLVGSPIPESVAQKMSNQSWLRAMQKYQGGYEHRELLRGGARQLSQVLEREIKEAPSRFYDLLQLVPDDVDDEYIMAYLNGLAEADSPAEWFFDAVRRFSRQEDRKIKRTIAWALEKRIQDGIPSDLVELLQSYVHSEMSEDELWWSKGRNHGDVYNSYLNSDRGAAFQVLMRHYVNIDDEVSVIQRWKLVEFAASDESTALHIGAIDHLTYLIRFDRTRAITLFEKIMTGQDVLLDTLYMRDFIYWAMYKNFTRLRPYIEKMLEREAENTQNQGAQLACIAALSKDVLESVEAVEISLHLAEKAMTGSLPQRRGAARIYSNKLIRGSATICEEKVILLLDEEDEVIQRSISIIFSSMNSEHFDSLRPFIEAYARKTRMLEIHFTDFLQKYGRLDPDWTLRVINTLLDNRLWQGQSYYWRLGTGGLIRLVLQIYTLPTVTEEIQNQAMDIFDRLMQQDTGEAYKILEEWDHR